MLTTQATARYPLVEQASCSDLPTRAARDCAKKHGWLDGGRWGDRCGGIELQVIVIVIIIIIIVILIVKVIIIVIIE